MKKKKKMEEKEKRNYRKISPKKIKLNIVN